MDTREAGRRGGVRRAARLTPAERREAARKAAEARWSLEKKQDHLAIRRSTAAAAAQMEMTRSRLIRESLFDFSRVRIAIAESRQVVAWARKLVVHSRNLQEEAQIGSEVSEQRSVGAPNFF